MKWTREMPTQPGWYWFRFVGPTEEPTVVNVTVMQGQLLVYDARDQDWMAIDEGEWAGPIPEPEDACE